MPVSDQSPLRRNLRAALDTAQARYDLLTSVMDQLPDGLPDPLEVFGSGYCAAVSVNYKEAPGLLAACLDKLPPLPLTEVYASNERALKPTYALRESDRGCYWPCYPVHFRAQAGQRNAACWWTQLGELVAEVRVQSSVTTGLNLPEGALPTTDGRGVRYWRLPLAPIRQLDPVPEHSSSRWYDDIRQIEATFGEFVDRFGLCVGNDRFEEVLEWWMQGHCGKALGRPSVRLSGSGAEIWYNYPHARSYYRREYKLRLQNFDGMPLKFAA